MIWKPTNTVKVICTSLLVLSIGRSHPVSAQVQEDVFAPLSMPPACLELRSALDLAAETDPNVMRSLAQEADFEARITEARALRRPNLSGFGRSGIGDTSVVDNAVSNQIGLQLSQRIFDFGDSRLAREEAEANRVSSRYDTDQERLLAARTAGQAYLTYLEADATLNQTSERQDYFAQQRDSLDRLVDVGGATLTELATVAAEVSDAEAFALELAFQKEQALIVINLATGRSDRPCSGLPAQWLSGHTSLMTETDLLANNPQIQSLSSTVDALSAASDRQSKSRLPVLSVVATGSYASIGGFDTFEYRDRVGIDVSVPLYAGNALGASKARARSREQQARSDVRIAERNLMQAYRTSVRRVQILERQLAARAEATKQKQRLLAAAEREQSVGTLTFRELVEIRLDYEASVIALIGVEFDLARQRLEIRFLKGDL